MRQLERKIVSSILNTLLLILVIFPSLKGLNAQVKTPPVPQPVDATPETATTPRAHSPETQVSLEIDLGAPIQTAEGTTLTLSNAQVKYSGASTPQFQWQLVMGSSEVFKILNPTVLKPQIKIGNLEQPVGFLLRLQVTAGGLTQTKDLQIYAYPAKLFLAKTMGGGGWVGIDHMGDKWVTSRGSELLIMDAQLNPITNIPLKRPITQFFPILYSNQKGAVFVQAPEGNWSVYQYDPVQQNKRTELLMLGSKIRRVVPFDWQGVPYIFALLPDHIELWNLTDPSHPKLKSSFGNHLHNPLYLAFAERLLYVAEENFIHLLEYPSGNLIASVPSGGSITSLIHYQLEGKNYLLASIGQDRTTQGRKDFGLRIFSLDTTGRLGEEHRVAFADPGPIERAVIIPNQAKALIDLRGKSGGELRLADLKTFKEIPLQGEVAKRMLPLVDLETGRLNNQPIIVAQELSRLRILGVQSQGEPPQTYSARRLKTFFGMVSAAWLDTTPQGDKIIIGDEGTTQGGLLEMGNGTTLQIENAFAGAPGSYPAYGEIIPDGKLNPVLFRSEKLDPHLGKRPEGQLALLSNIEGEAAVEFSSFLLEKLNPQVPLKVTALVAQSMTNSLKILLGISPAQNATGGGGVWILDKLPTQSTAAFLNPAYLASSPYFPIPTVRDMALTTNEKTAYLASGEGGVMVLDLESKQILSQMKLNAPHWLADRVLLSHQEDMVFVSFLNPLTRTAIIKLFGITPNRQLQEYGTISSLSAIPSVEGFRAPKPAITEDDRYLFTSTQPNVLTIFNLSDPAQPEKIQAASLEGEIRSIAIANRYRDVFVALGPVGLVKLIFGF